MIFYTIWLLTRKTHIGVNDSVYCLGNLIKPFIISLGFTYSRLLFQRVSIGILNPTLVFSAWIFNQLLFRDLFAAGSNPSQQLLNEKQDMNKYAWIYGLAAAFAAPFAGLIARVIL